MKTPEEANDEEQQRSSNSTAPDRSLKKTNAVSFPPEILESILSRLPAKSILRSKSVSKPWLSLLSDQHFTNLHFTLATSTHRRTRFFISAFDRSTRQCHYLTAPNHGGPLTKLITVHNSTGGLETTGPSQLHGGLICFTSKTRKYNYNQIDSDAFVVNPATRKVFQLPDMNSPEYALSGYLYGFDESIREYKILLVRKVFETEEREFMVYSMSSYLWRKIDAEPPIVGFDWRRLGGGFGGGVCVNSKVHTMLSDMSFDILAFDFVTEKFEVIGIPDGVQPPPDDDDDDDLDEGMGMMKLYIPAITNIEGCLGVVVFDRERSEVRVWLLQDYEKRVWVKETIKFPQCWNELVGRVPPTIDVMDDEIVFCLCKRTENVISVPVYNMKTKCFRSVQFALDDQFASPKSVSFRHICCYSETIMPLVDNWSNTSHDQGD